MADLEDTESDLQDTGSQTQIDLTQLETDPQETASLKHIAESCERYLQKLLQNEDAQEDIVKAKRGHWASRQYAEFNLWCVKVGVHDEGHRSIDVRLKDVPEICNLLGRLLQSMERDFNELERLADPYADDDDDDDDGNGNDGEDDAESDASLLSFDSLSSNGPSDADCTPETSTLSSRRRNLELQAHIEDTIDRLHGHALRITDAGASHRRRRVELYRQKKGPKAAYDGFKALALHKARFQFKKASEPFLERLAESFARRRIRFEYLREHQKKRIIDTPELEQTSAPKLQTGSGVRLAEENKAPERKGNFTSPSRPQDMRTVYSQTVQTKLDLRPQPKQPQKAESVASVALRNPGFPPPPQCTNGRFHCPYCRLEFRSREAEKGYWSQHVMQDFEPYFCIWEECHAPFDVPNTFEGLLSHLQTHMEVKYHVDMPDGGHKTFDETGFERHIAQYGNVSEEMLTVMKEASRRKAVFIFESCPFCGGFPDNVEKRFPDRESLECQRELRRHVKQHMQDVALFLPPHREDIFYENNEDNMTSAASHRKSAGQGLVEDPSEFVDSCLREDCDCKRVSIYDESFGALPDEPPNPVAAPWAKFFPDLPRYDPSPVQDDYYLSEKKLQPFVVRAQGEISDQSSSSSEEDSTQSRLSSNMMEVIVEFAEGIKISCNGIGVIHGHLLPGSDPASLIIYSFQIPPIKAQKRLTRVEIKLTYWCINGEPNIQAIAFDGQFLLRPTATAGEVKTIFGNAPVGLDIERGLNNASYYENHDTAAVIGEIYIAFTDFKHAHSASWILTENASTKTGVPTVLHTAVLVAMPNDGSFRYDIDCTCFTSGDGTEPEQMYRARKQFPGHYFSLLPTIKMRGLDAENLSSIDLEQFSYISF